MKIYGKEMLSAKEKYKQSACLISKSGENLNCHEHDFCKCDVDILIKEAEKALLDKVLDLIDKLYIDPPDNELSEYGLGANQAMECLKDDINRMKKLEG